MTTQIRLATIALGPDRWGGITEQRRAAITAGDWLDPARDAGFDGIELWEAHRSRRIRGDCRPSR